MDSAPSCSSAPPAEDCFVDLLPWDEELELRGFSLGDAFRSMVNGWAFAGEASAILPPDMFFTDHHEKTTGAPKITLKQVSHCQRMHAK
jgi:hypothetical protein